jgi:hypothetical protein
MPNPPDELIAELVAALEKIAVCDIPLNSRDKVTGTERSVAKIAREALAKAKQGAQ